MVTINNLTLEGANEQKPGVHDTIILLTETVREY